MNFAAAGFAFGMGAVGGARGDDAAVLDAVLHEGAGVFPECSQLGGGDLVSFGEGADAGAVEKFGAVNVADAADDRLVHEQSGDGRAAAGDAADEGCGIGVGAQGVGSDAGQELFAGSVGEDIAGGGAAQFQPVGGVGNADAQCAFGFGIGHFAVTKFAVEAEVNVQLAVFAEVVEEVLAEAFDGAEFMFVDQLSALRKAAVGCVDADYGSGEVFVLEVGIAVDFVSFGQVDRLAGDKRR